MYTNGVFGTAKCVLFIEVSLFQGVLNKGYMYIQLYLGGNLTLVTIRTCTCLPPENSTGIRTCRIL